MVKITLPNPNDFQYEGGVKHFLRQLELCVHHAQKALEQIEVDKQPESEANLYVVYRFPKTDLYNRKDDEEGFVKVHVDEESGSMQNIEIEINCV